MSRLFWTPEKIDILITYLRNGLSKQQIMKKMEVTIDALTNAIRRYSLQEHIVAKPATQKFINNVNLDDLNDENFKEKIKEAKLRWKIAKSRKKKTKGKKFETAIFFPDAHIPHQNDNVIRAILGLMDDIKFDKMIIAGDFLDLGCISHWNRNRHRTLEMKRLKSDYIMANGLLDEFDRRLPRDCEKYFLKGNHEKWADDLLEEMPALEGLIEPKDLLSLKERNYEIYEYNQLLKLGRLYVTHGIYAGGNPIKKHLDELKVNVLFAHTHTLGMKLSSSPARDIAFAGYNIGCVCDLAPDYMKNRPNAWTHGFAIGYFYPNGYFDVQLVRVVDGRFVFNGKMYDGNKKCKIKK